MFRIDQLVCCSRLIPYCFVMFLLTKDSDGMNKGYIRMLSISVCRLNSQQEEQFVHHMRLLHSATSASKVSAIYILQQKLPELLEMNKKACQVRGTSFLASHCFRSWCAHLFVMGTI